MTRSCRQSRLIKLSTACHVFCRQNEQAWLYWLNTSGLTYASPGSSSRSVVASAVLQLAAQHGQHAQAMAKRDKLGRSVPKWTAVVRASPQNGFINVVTSAH